MLKWEKTAKLIVTILVLLNFIIVGISMLPTNTVTAAPLPSNMPVVFVDPQNITANPGDSFTVSVKVFNLTKNFYGASDPQWWQGDPLPPPGSKFNYSLGHLFGLDIQLSWPPEILEYVSHTAKIPVETYPDGILHQPLFDLKDDVVIGDVGTYWLAKSSYTAPVFSCPNANATVFEMTFTVKKLGTCIINITNADLVAQKYPLAQQAIPHWTKPAQFQTELLATRIEKLDVGALVNNVFYDPPIILGEDAQVKIAMVNDGNTTDTCNITLYDGTTVLNTWVNKTLEAGERKIFNHSIAASDLTIGNATFNVNVTSSVLERMGSTENEDREFTVIGTPTLTITGPTTATAGDEVNFDSSGSTHTDPSGSISYYTWILTAENETQPRTTIKGNATIASAVKFELHRSWSARNWTVALEVEDNYGVTYDKNRPLTAPYRAIKILEISEYAGPGIFNLENIALIVIIVVVIVAAAIYLRRRSR